MGATDEVESGSWIWISTRRKITSTLWGSWLKRTNEKHCASLTDERKWGSSSE